MTPSFSSYLVNPPFGDPGLYVEIRWDRRALLFDLGENELLGPTRLLRTSDVFISHTHMDHFIGFDRLLRIALGRGKVLRLYGPPGLIDNVAGKLRGYTWNLVEDYPLAIEVREFHVSDSTRPPQAPLHPPAPGLPGQALFPGDAPLPVRSVSAVFRAKDGFAPHEDHAELHAAGESFPVLIDPMFTVAAAPLNHRIPSFAYSLQEKFHVNINKERLHAAGLPVGSWLMDVKQYLWDGRPDDFRFMATLYFEHRKESREFVLGEVRDRFVTITRGQKIAYVVDARFDEENTAKITHLARGADIFYCEAPYLDRDADKARERYHLTARQAGLLAGQAGVRELIVFHFSPRYTGQEDLLYREAKECFTGARYLPGTPDSQCKLP
jgi:ribonuclease Z